MTEILNRIFGRDVQQTFLQYVNEMKAKGNKFVQEMRFTGVLHNPSQAVFGFLKSDVTVKLDAKFEVEDGKTVYITEATLTPETPWFKKYFFFCKTGNHFNFPPFPSVAELKAKWCQSKVNANEKYPDRGEWCATSTQTLDDYYKYGDPYPKSLQECSVVRSMQVYSFHFRPDSDDGIDVKSNIRYDLRASTFLGYLYLDNGGKVKYGYNISKYFVGGLILGGAYEDFKKFLAKTKASMDCTPALEGLLQAMIGQRFATR